MDRNNADMFSPVNNFNEGNNRRLTDSFSEFLKGPDSFPKISTKIAENVGEETLILKSTSKCSVESSVQSVTDAFPKACRIEEIKTDNQPSSSSQCKKLPQVYSDESSMQSGAAAVSECVESMETNCPSSSSQHNPLSQIQSRIEKMVSDALESQIDNLQQIMWSHHYNLLQALHENMETLKHRHAVEREALCKVMEELSAENRQLRDAAINHE